MSRRWIVEHTCRSPREDGGLPFACACEQTLSKSEAEALVASGRAAWKLQQSGGRGAVEVHDAVVLKPLGHSPLARTISAGDIECAYIKGNVSAARRIEEFRPRGE